MDNCPINLHTFILRPGLPIFMYSQMHIKTSPVHFIPLYEFPSAKQRLICPSAGTAKPKPRGFPPRAAAPWQTGCAAGSEQG